MHGPRRNRQKIITRINNLAKHTHGYYVQIVRAGKKHGQYFSDHMYGDRLGALAAAIDWRDNMEEQSGKPRIERHVEGLHSSKNSGIRGIRRRKRSKANLTITRRGKKKGFRLA